MKNNGKLHFMSFVVVAVTAIMGMFVLAIANGSASENGGSISDSSTQEADTTIETDVLVICPERRPQVCTREYRPVCARMKDGSFKTYSNGCTSCTDPNVVGYRDGGCELKDN